MNQHQKKQTIKQIIFSLSGEAETGNARDQRLRNNPMNENDPEAPLVSSGSFKNHFCSNS
ncbi:MAG: hypothetical protein IT223_05690 [Crocinitomicaceae bacterium]|nr:hypothetical protein [Crocinitomicaceae bacterium]